MLVIAYAVRRLPYALRSCMAALQQLHVSLEEAAENLGAAKARTIRRIVVPLMAGGILAGFVTSFITAAVELSATIMLLVIARAERADVLRHLPLHAVHRRPRPGRGARRHRGRDRRRSAPTLSHRLARATIAPRRGRGDSRHGSRRMQPFASKRQHRARLRRDAGPARHHADDRAGRVLRPPRARPARASRRCCG